ncbi:hypothetical protein ACTPEM_25500, partial [Clostridioides difficile]
VVQFDTYNKKVNLYDIDSFGDNIELVLTYDNYIKSNKKTNSTLSHTLIYNVSKNINKNALIVLTYLDVLIFLLL